MRSVAPTAGPTRSALTPGSSTEVTGPDGIRARGCGLLALGVVSGLLAAGVAAQASVILQLGVSTQTSGEYGLSYNAFPGMADTEFANPESAVTQFVRIASPDQQHLGYLNNPDGTGSSSIGKVTLEDLNSALTGTWTLTDSLGSPSQSEYTFDVDLGSLLSGGLPETQIQSPIHGSLGNSLTPTFGWTGNGEHDFQVVTLTRLNSDPLLNTVIASEFLADATLETWSPGVTLEPGTRYAFEVLRQATVSFDGTVSNPQDALNVPWPHGWAGIDVVRQANASIEFTTVPEPTAVAGGMVLLLWAGWRRCRAGR